ncbi:MAG: AraC family transcriptional regulator [Gammaproteobacteria bacterium]
MHRVVAYIDRHLEQPLDLNTLAEVAHFSRFHFHRLFSAWMGETFGDYLRRRRVEVAAMRLAAQPRAMVLNIALSVGFGSAEAFTRAFRSRFGCSPTAWRTQQIRQRSANSNPGQVNSKISQAPAAFSAEHAVSQTSNMETIMNVKLIDRQPVTVAYLRHIGPYGEPLSKFWQNTYKPWAVMNKLGGDHARYGIGYDDPSITAPEQCRYDACAEVAPDFVASGGALKTTIPGGRYAALSFKGTVKQVGEAWTALLRDWLPSSGLQLDARPCFEFYPKGAAYDSQTGAFECEICIPVVPL